MSEKFKEENKINRFDVSTVYEILKSKGYLHQIYHDVILCLKNTPTYNSMKNLLEDLINGKIDDLESIPHVDSYDSFEKTTVAEICSVSLASDIVSSRLLYTYIEKRYPSLVNSLVKDLRNEGKIPDDIWNNLEIPSNSLNNDSNGKSKGTKNSTNQQKETSKSPSVAQAQNQKKKLVNCKNMQNYRYSRRNNTEKEKSPPKKMETRTRATSKGASSKPSTSASKKNFSKQNGFNKKTDVTVNSENFFQEVNRDDDADSLASDGDVSLASISSVHTSDLSSFDDEVSVSSEDEEEGEKKGKTLTIKDCGKLLDEIRKKRIENVDNQNGKESDKSIKPSKDDQSSSVDKRTDIEASIEDADKLAESGFSEISTTGSSKRVRKPNSRYSSNNVLRISVKVKDRKKHPSFSEENGFEHNSSEKVNPKRKMSSTEIAETGVDTPKKVQKIDTVKGTPSDEKNLSQQHKSSELPKLQSPVRSLTSRRTAITLFSTEN